MARSLPVSVLMPVRNGEPFLAAAIESVLSQSLADLELIVVDDGSTDSSADVIRRYAARDDRVLPLFNDTSLGMAASLNRALTEASGLYCARMDADDESERGRLQRQYEFLEAGNAILCGTAARTFGRGRERILRYASGNEELRVRLMFQDSFVDPTVMASTEMLRAVGGWSTDLPYAPDYDLWTRIAARGRIANLPEALYRYRRHAGQMTVASRARQGEDAAVVKRRYLNALGLRPTHGELEAHVRLRYPASFPSLDLLTTAEAWLQKLHERFQDYPLRRAVAEQWLRACIRAACFGLATFRRYRSSPLCPEYGPSTRELSELFVLCVLGLNYRSVSFEWLERFSGT